MSTSASNWSTILGETLIDNSTEIKTSDFKASIVALYFSAHWCPPVQIKKQTPWIFYTITHFFSNQLFLFLNIYIMSVL